MTYKEAIETIKEYCRKSGVEFSDNVNKVQHRGLTILMYDLGGNRTLSIRIGE